MTISHGLNSGDVITNTDLTEIFKCSPRGGMRRSKRTNTLVLITGGSPYRDRWEGDLFLYTGMGLTGNQNLDYQQNHTLFESNESGIDIFLFEKLTSNRYKYIGAVALAGEPHRETQNDVEGNPRDVWIFPLKVKDDDKNVSVIERQTYLPYQQIFSMDDTFHRTNNFELSPKGTLSIIGREGLPFWSIVYFFEKTISNHMKLTIIERICELSSRGVPDHHFSVATKSIDVLASKDEPIGFYDDYVILETKSRSPRRFWQLIGELDRPLVIYDNGHNKFSLYDANSVEALRISQFIENSPFKTKFNGSLSPLKDLFRSEQDINLQQAERYNNYIRDSISILDSLISTSQRINDPQTAPQIRAYASEQVSMLISFQQQLNRSLGITGIRLEQVEPDKFE